MSQLRPIAIHLPQFHPIPENNRWWGTGFTEWTNVTKARPRFPNHYQPHLPTYLGFYDLRLHESRLAQEQLARAYGLHGFCYYHYWFSGQRLLAEPVDRKLDHPREDLPFMLCWANENWTRNWDGQSQLVLLEQRYSPEDDEQHLQHLLRYFRDPRYITVDGRPVFAVYKTALFPDIRRTAHRWRQLAQEAGLPGLYLLCVESQGQPILPESIGFDSSVEFQPNFSRLPPAMRRDPWSRILRRLGLRSAYFKDRIMDYRIHAQTASNTPLPQYKRFPGITPMWDNSARRSSGATILHNSTPEAYGSWLKAIVEKFYPYSEDENFLFINAWNEWAEGNHLEPCRKWGLRYLETTRDVLHRHAPTTS